MKATPCVFASLLVLGSIFGQKVEAAQFIPLSDLLPVTNETSSVIDVSNDGSTVVGYYTSDQGTRAFQWKLGVGIITIEDETDHLNVHVRTVSSDGRKILGECANGAAQCLWTEGEGFQYLDFLPGPTLDISGDGAVILGYVDDPILPNQFRDGYIWNATTGLTIIPKTAMFTRLDPRDISDDGLAVVGSQGGMIGSSAFHWTQASGTTELQGQGSVATKTSAEGSVLIGHGPTSSTIPTGQHDRWTESTGWQELPPLPGINSLEYGFNDITADGKFIVGYSRIPASPLIREPIIWDAMHDTRNLRTLLELDTGSPLTGWDLRDALAISADHTVIVGQGMNPSGQLEGWVMVFEPAEIDPGPGD